MRLLTMDSDDGLFFMGLAIPRCFSAVPQPGTPGDLGVGAIFRSAYRSFHEILADADYGARRRARAWHFGDDSRFQIPADHLWHITIPSWDVPGGRLPIYVGAGCA